MKKRKLKAFVIPTLYVLAIGALFISIAILENTLQYTNEFEGMSVNSVVEEKVQPVIKEEIIPTTIMPMKPFASENVSVSKSYYNMNDDATTQQNSLVYYEKTYLQNSGILYSSSETFDVLSTLDGTVTNVAKDEILGNYVEITHNPNLKTIYYSLGEVVVKKDDIVKTGTIIATSGDNMLEQESNNCLLFEVYYNGKTMNPDTFYNTNVEELN